MEFHLIKDDDFKKDVVNVVMGVEVTEAMEAACLRVLDVCLVHDEFMLESLIQAAPPKHNHKNDWRDVAKWMTYDSKPLSITSQNWEEFIRSEEATKFLEQDYELSL